MGEGSALKTAAFALGLHHLRALEESRGVGWFESFAWIISTMSLRQVNPLTIVQRVPHFPDESLPLPCLLFLQFNEKGADFSRL